MEDGLFQVPFVRAKFKSTYGDLEGLSELSMWIDRKIIVSGESCLCATGMARKNRSLLSGQLLYVFNDTFRLYHLIDCCLLQ